MNSNTLWLIGRRLGAAIVTLLIVSMVVFAITAVLPGDAAQQSLGQFATPEQVAALRLKMGLDQPGVLRYLHWLMNLLSGDMGQSVSNAMPVSRLDGRAGAQHPDAGGRHGVGVSAGGVDSGHRFGHGPGRAHRQLPQLFHA